METKNGHHGGNSFIFGLVLGALLATLITTKRGRQIIRDLTELGIEVFEGFMEEKTQGSSKKAKVSQEEINEEEVANDLASEVTEVETGANSTQEEPQEEITPTKNGNGHARKRLFKGIRRK